MGKTICCRIVEEQKSWWQSLEPADWIAMGGIVVNFFIAFWIIQTIQNKMTNKRVLKDHFINEIKDLRIEYRACLQNLYSDKALPKNILIWFKLMNIKTGDLLDFLSSKYKIDRSKLVKYHRDFRELVTNNHDFINQFGNTTPLIFSEESKRKLIKLQQENNKVFNELIIKINDAD